MSSTVEAMPMEKSNNKLPWSLWLRQTGAILRIELKKNFFSKRAVLIYLLALLPVLLMLALALFPPTDTTVTVTRDAQGNQVRNVTRTSSLGDFNQTQEIFAVIYNGLILRTVVFFGCAWIFMNLFRGEMVDRSLHYYFLSALRREVLVAGKYFSGLLTSAFLFSATTLVSMLLLYFPHAYNESARYFSSGRGLGQLLTYLGITILACIGYGAFFLVVGLFFRNPILPALVLYGWEWLNFLLPPLLKKVSVIHYLQSLMPIPLSEGPFAVVAEPTPAWIAIPSLLVVTACVLIGASLRIQKMEIRYGSE
jgi:ABC-type transport system involved in multi-copper enzyme maturation permease subunit